jgi:hypothetical protein
LQPQLEHPCFFRFRHLLWQNYKVCRVHYAHCQHGLGKLSFQNWLGIETNFVWTEGSLEFCAARFGSSHALAARTLFTAFPVSLAIHTSTNLIIRGYFPSPISKIIQTRRGIGFIPWRYLSNTAGGVQASASRPPDPHWNAFLKRVNYSSLTHPCFSKLFGRLQDCNHPQTASTEGLSRIQRDLHSIEVKA